MGHYDDLMTGSVWRCRDHVFPLGERTLVMGIVNATPDSFYAGGRHASADAAKPANRSVLVHATAGGAPEL